MSEVVNEISKVIPLWNLVIFLWAFFVIFKVVNEVLINGSGMYTDDIKFNYNRLKFWEWRIRYYIPFYFITIIITSIINKNTGFIISIMLFWITLLYKFPKELSKWYDGKKEKGED